MSSDSAARSAPAATTHSCTKVKRTPVVLNCPRRPVAARFRVLQWNVLADGLAQNGDFCRVPPSCLEWGYRKPLLLQEIMESNADIICLQELNHFDELRRVLGQLGYEGAFRPKHASPALKYDCPPDGMAVFYRSARFACDDEGVEGASFQDDAGREQSQGYLRVALTDRWLGRRLVVVTTHLKAKDGPECEQVRLAQAHQLLDQVAATVQRLEEQAAEGPAAAAPAAAGGGSEPAGATGAGAPAAAGTNGAAASSAAHGPANGSGSGHRNGNGNGNGRAPDAAAAATPASAAAAADGRGGSSGGSNGQGRVHAPSRVPIVVTGDFNTLPQSVTCEAFRSHPLGLLSLWEQPPLDATLSSSDNDWPGPVTFPRPAAAAGPAAGVSSSGAGAAPAAAAPAAAGAAGAGGAGAGGDAAAALGTTASASSWSVWGGSGAEFSTWKFRVKGESKRISDYIWFSGCGALRPLLRWRMLTEDEIGPAALPSSAYGSDHISLCCEFEWDVPEADLIDWAPRAGGELEWG